jgi:hypothetical protein
MEPETRTQPGHESLRTSFEASETDAQEYIVQPRTRRRRRSAARKLFDGLIPVAILVALFVMAAGVVGMVERGAAKASRRNDRPAVEPLVQISPTNLDRSLQSENPELVPLTQVKRPQSGSMSIAANKTAGQLRANIQAEMGFLPPADVEEAASMDDVMDWGLIEEAEILRDKSLSKTRTFTP